MLRGAFCALESSQPHAAAFSGSVFECLNWHADEDYFLSQMEASVARGFQMVMLKVCIHLQ